MKTPHSTHLRSFYHPLFSVKTSGVKELGDSSDSFICLPDWYREGFRRKGGRLRSSHSIQEKIPLCRLHLLSKPTLSRGFNIWRSFGCILNQLKGLLSVWCFSCSVFVPYIQVFILSRETQGCSQALVTTSRCCLSLCLCKRNERKIERGVRDKGSHCFSLQQQN